VYFDTSRVVDKRMTVHRTFWWSKHRCGWAAGMGAWLEPRWREASSPRRCPQQWTAAAVRLGGLQLLTQICRKLKIRRWLTSC